MRASLSCLGGVVAVAVAAVLVGGTPARATVELSTATTPRAADAPPSTWAPLAGASLPLPGGDASSAWLRLHIADGSAAGGGVRFIELGAPLLTRVTFFIDDARGARRVALSPDEGYASRPVPSASPTVEVALDAAGSATLVARIDDPGPLAVPVAVRDATQQVHAAERRALVIGASLGFALLILVYNLLMFAVTRESSFGAYCLYLAPCVVITAAFGGVLAYLPGISAATAAAAPAPLGSLIGAAAIYFVQVFLQTRARFPRLNRALTIALASALVMVALHFILPPAAELTASIVITLYGVGALLVAVGVALVRDPRRTAFFALAWGSLLLFIFVGTLAMAGALPQTFLTENAVVIGQSVEYALLALAVADRINLLKDERERALVDKLAVAQKNAALSSTFERYVPKEFLSELAKPSILDIRRGDQTEKEMTIFFSDIRSFTSISERMTPAEVFALINEYLAAMAPGIQREGGFIDKYIGDAVMALFAPGAAADGPDRAVRAALANMRALDELNRARALSSSSPALAIGIGLHTGSLMLGMLGSEERLNATVLGDSVNLASRVEGMTKSYGAHLLITEATRVKLKGSYAMRAVDRVRVKGKSAPVLVHEIFEGTPLAAQKAQTASTFADALALFQAGDMDAAERRFHDVLAVFDDAACRLYIERCAHYRAQGVPAGWDGVVDLKSK